MNELLLLTGIVIMLCILTDRFTDRLGIPSLLAFIALGMCFGVDGIFKIPFDDYEASEMICSVSLVFIMFYGGFGTNIKEAKPVIARSVVLSTAGVVLTAGLTGLFIHFVLGLSLLESLLTASVIGSTDAASVFGILRSKNLNLKEHTASLLEMESSYFLYAHSDLDRASHGRVHPCSGYAVSAAFFRSDFWGSLRKGSGLGLKPPAVSDYRGKDHFCICRGCSCLCRSCAFGRKRVFKRVSLRNHYGKFFHAS